MRRLTHTAVVLCTLAFARQSLAQDAAKSPAEMPPKPPPALTEAFKPMTGTWACKGKFQTMDGSGKTIESKSTMVLKSELDGFAYSGDYRVEKNATLPNGMKGQLFWSYDAANKKLVEFFVDSFGGLGHGTSDGLKGDTVVWDEDGVMMGKANKSRTTTKRASPKELTLTFEIQGADGTWNTVGTDACKKQ
jgi:Protein of unknown function (DUF1579)